MINKIYQGDFRDIMTKDMRLLSPVIISDPPYNIQFKNYSGYTDNMKTQLYINMISSFFSMRTVLIHYPEETMKYFVPALGVPNKSIAWCYNSNIARRVRLINFFNCDPDLSKVKQPYKNPNDKRVRKLIENGSKGRNMYEWFDDIQLVKNVSKEKHHPCPVPIKLMERIITLCSNENDIILDPFMGSGTTCLAAKNLNRSYIGIELDENYYNIAKERLDDCKGADSEVKIDKGVVI